MRPAQRQHFPVPAEELFGPPRGYAALSAEEAAYATAQAVILSVPYDSTTTYRAGTRDGPRAIIDASMQMELYDMELGYEVASAGIHTLPELEPHLGDPALMVRRVQDATEALLADGKLPIMLGGEHTITAGSVAACAARHPDLAILYLDAHADVRDPYLGAKYNHASALRLALRSLSIPPENPPPVAAVGVRSMAVEEAAFIQEHRLHVISAAEVALARRTGPAALDALWSRTLAALGPPGRPLYVSVDLDAFDPGAVAAVGTPEPGGLDWYDVTSLLRAAAGRFSVVMADVVELAPAEGPAASAFTAAKLVYKLIGYALAKKNPRPQ